MFFTHTFILWPFFNVVSFSDTSSTAVGTDLEETSENGALRGDSTGTGRGSLEHQQPLGRNGGEALSQHFAGSPTFEMQEMDAREVTSRTHGGDGGGRELELIGEGLGGGGARALLRTPHVNTVLFLGFAIQVRQV